MENGNFFLAPKVDNEIAQFWNLSAIFSGFILVTEMTLHIWSSANLVLSPVMTVICPFNFSIFPSVAIFAKKSSQVVVLRISKCILGFHVFIRKVTVKNAGTTNAFRFNDQFPSHIETNQLICSVNQFTGFYLRRTLFVKVLSNISY